MPWLAGSHGIISRGCSIFLQLSPRCCLHGEVPLSLAPNVVNISISLLCGEEVKAHFEEASGASIRILPSLLSLSAVF